jgi:quercetin dioxygenase-like cupin family protein
MSELEGLMTTTLARKGTPAVLDVFGPTGEVLTSPSEGYCVILGTIPPGVSVPTHAHADFEGFFVVPGAVQVLAQRGDGFEWLEARRGDFLQFPGGAKHGFRNASAEPVVQLITTTPRLGRFFREVGRPVTAGESLPPPSPAELRLFAEVATRYVHWLGSPQENAAVGIDVPAV